MKDGGGRLATPALTAAFAVANVHFVVPTLVDPFRLDRYLSTCRAAACEMCVDVVSST